MHHQVLNKFHANLLTVQKLTRFISSWDWGPLRGGGVKGEGGGWCHGMQDHCTSETINYIQKRSYQYLATPQYHSHTNYVHVQNIIHELIVYSRPQYHRANWYSYRHWHYWSSCRTGSCRARRSNPTFRCTPSTNCARQSSSQNFKLKRRRGVIKRTAEHRGDELKSEPRCWVVLLLLRNSSV